MENVGVYVIDAGVRYLCESCHPRHYTPEEWAAEYADGESGSYWTEWEEDDGGATMCQWFAGCRNVATGETAHPVLGDVPTCDRCHIFAAK